MQQLRQQATFDRTEARFEAEDATNLFQRAEARTQYAGELGNRVSREQRIGALDIQTAQLRADFEIGRASATERQAVRDLTNIRREAANSVATKAEEIERNVGSVLSLAGARGLDVAGSPQAQADDIGRIGARELGIIRGRAGAAVEQALDERVVAQRAGVFARMKGETDVRRIGETAVRRVLDLVHRARTETVAANFDLVASLRKSQSEVVLKKQAEFREHAAALGTWSLANRPGIPDYIGLAQREARNARIGGGLQVAAGVIGTVGGLASAAPSIISGAKKIWKWLT